MAQLEPTFAALYIGSWLAAGGDTQSALPAKMSVGQLMPLAAAIAEGLVSAGAKPM